MELLKNKILDEGKVIEDRILKVDCFLNHQMDIGLFNEMGKEFKNRFQKDEINKILTIEASGIGIACITSQYFDNAAVVFAKKTLGANTSADTYSTKVHSFTKNQDYKVQVAKNYINKGDKILIIDDFLANGCAALGLIDLVKQGGGEVVGVGIVIEKGFQEGRQAIESQGIRVESLAIVESFNNNSVIFKD